jgi:hypothetical protein
MTATICATTPNRISRKVLPRARRRRGGDLRWPVCHAHLAPSGEAHQIRHDVRRYRPALRTYNVEISAGQFGGAPAVEGQRLNASIIVQSLLKTPEEFAAIPLRTNPDGSVVRISDVGRAELGTENYDIDVDYNGMPSTGIAIRQAAGANALDTADAVRAKFKEMSRLLPGGNESGLSLRHHAVRSRRHQ